MSPYTLHIAAVCLLWTLLIQALAPRMPPALLQAARLAQVLLGLGAIYFAAAWVVHGRLL